MVVMLTPLASGTQPSLASSTRTTMANRSLAEEVSLTTLAKTLISAMSTFSLREPRKWLLQEGDNWLGIIYGLAFEVRRWNGGPENYRMQNAGWLE